MNGDREQDQLHALFSELKRSDERKTPDFDRDWDAAIARGEESPPVMLPVAGAVLGLLIAIAAWAVISHHRPGNTSVVKVPGHTQTKTIEFSSAPDSVTEWRSPTSFLLSSPTDAIWPQDNDDRIDESSSL